MRAVLLKEFGPPSSLRLATLPDPIPRAGEIVVRVEACGVCGHDLLARRGMLPHTTLPAVLGHEIAGTVTAVGPGVGEIAIGDRVASTPRRTCHRCRYCRSGRETLCPNQQFYGERIFGGYADSVALDALGVARIPQEMTAAVAAIAACTVGTCLHALRRLDVQLGDQVMVTGAGGGLGVHAIQLARLAGASVVAVTASPHKVEHLERWADHVVVARPGELRGALRRAGLAVDRAIELTAGLTLPETLRVLSPGGRVCVLGNIEMQGVSLNPGLVIVREIEIVGSASATREDLVDALALLDSSAVDAVIGEVLPLSEAAGAHRLTEARQVVGRIVLRPS